MRIRLYRNWQALSLCLILFLIGISSIPMSSAPVSAIADNPKQDFVSSALYGQVEGVPYVWQEMGGFCLSAALSMTMQYAGANLSMHNLFAASGTGFTSFYMRTDDYTSFYPGVWFRQLLFTDFVSELYGLDMCLSFDTDSEFGSSMTPVLDTWELEYSDVNGYLGSFRYLRNTIDSGYPLVLFVDPSYLPLEDFDFMRERGLTIEDGLTAHAIVITGYNHTAQIAQVYDPGAGLFGDDFGYPSDGRWNYTISFHDLNDAWLAQGYTSILVEPDTGKDTDYEYRLISYIRDRLLGDRTAYFAGYESYFHVSVGEKAFRGMGLDMTVESWKSFFNAHEVSSSRTYNILKAIPNIFETTMTLQYLSYRVAIEALPELVPALDLSEFLDAAQEALPHLEALSHNASLVYALEDRQRDSVFYNTFTGMAKHYLGSFDLDSSIESQAEGLDEIADHLFAIADSWLAAGQILDQYLAENDGTGQFIALASISSTIVIIAVIVVIYRRRG